MSKKILIIDGNPSQFSYTACLAEEYQINAEKAGFDVKMLVLRDMDFNPILKYGYNRKQELEDDLKKAQEYLLWCDHLVIVSPVWWYSIPALLKGFFDRVLLPDFAFTVETRPKRKLIKLLSGRTATLIYTFGGPKNNLRNWLMDPFRHQIKDGMLDFVGFENIKCYPLYDTVGFRNIRRIYDFI